MDTEKTITESVKKPLSKKAKIALIAASGVVLLAGGITAGIFSNQILNIVNRWDDKIVIANVSDECKTEIGEFEDEEGILLPYKYLGSTETRPSKQIEGYGDVLSAHTFLIGRVSNVPFYNSGWTKFDYENIGIKITYSQITTTSVAEKLGTMRERTQSSHWKQSSKFEEKFETSAKGGIGPIKLNAENTINYQMNTEMSSEISSKYVSSSEQTTTSIETLQKATDYSVQLNSKNGFKKGKYYRLTLQQTASMYMVIYENSKKETETGKTSNAKFYELVSYLANPSDYIMVIEETDDPTIEPDKPEEEKFDPYLYEDCATWIENQRKEEEAQFPSSLKWIITEEDPVPPTRKEVLDPYFKDVDRVESDLYVRGYPRAISDVGKENNFSDRVTFQTLFKSKHSPTFAELFNSPDESDERYRGYGFKFIDLEIQLNSYQKDDGYAHTILVDTKRNNIKEWKEDLPNDCSIKQYHYKYEGLNALDKLRTTMVPSQADGWIEIMYDASGSDFDWWVNQDFTLKVWIYK